MCVTQEGRGRLNERRDGETPAGRGGGRENREEEGMSLKNEKKL